MKNKVKEAEDIIQQAAKLNLNVISFVSGDWGVPVKHYENVHYYRVCGYQSLLDNHHHSFPFFFNDPLERFFQKTEIIFNEKKDKPIVGFCGQASNSIYRVILDLGFVLYRNLKYYIGISKDSPQKFYASAWNRNKMLEMVESNSSCETNFIRREHYRGGAKSKEELQKTSLEYYQNMIDSQYILCIRGGGNFSVRLYEALSMGRIPVVLDTDCMYPLDDELNWNEMALMLKHEDLPNINELIVKYHQSLSAEEFRNKQLNNRKIWLEKFNPQYFLKKAILKYSNI